MTTYYTKDHEWIAVAGDIATVGVTSYAQGQLGDVVYVELPEGGKALSQGDEAAVVESVKAASEVYAPIDGEVTEANDALADAPAMVNEDPEAGAWFWKMSIADKSQLDDLMDAAAYKAYVDTL